MAVFSLLSLAGLLLIIYGFNLSPTIPIWAPPTYMQPVTRLLMLPALILLAAAYIPSNIRNAVRHPMLLAIVLWSLLHLLVNGDLAGMLLFGSVLAYGIYDFASVRARAALGPLGTRRGGLRGDVLAVGIGVLAFVFLYFIGHRWLSNIPLF